MYGLVAYAVAQRMHEVAVRIALGAQYADLLLPVMRDALALAAIGGAIGVAASFAFTRLLASLLFQVTTTDPIAFAAAPTVLVVLAGFASWIPTRRMARVDPSLALRAQ